MQTRNLLELWNSISSKKVNLIPLYGSTASDRDQLEHKIRTHYLLTGPLAFLHVHLRVHRDGEHYVIEAREAVAIANAIAYLSELQIP